MDYMQLANTAAMSTGSLLQIPKEIEAAMQFVDTQIQPKSFLELGICSGGTFFIWCYLVRPGGIKMGIDLPNGPYGNITLISEKDILDRTQFLKTIAPNTHICLGDSRDTQSIDWVRERLKGEKLDFIFIDADHTYEGVKADFNNYKEFVKPGGYILLHDIKNTKKHIDGNCTVYKLWEELEGEKIEFCDPAFEWGGIGAIKQGAA